METIFSTTAAHKEMLQMSEDEISEIRSISLIFKSDESFGRFQAEDFKENVAGLIDFHLRAVPHFHDSEIISKQLIATFPYIHTGSKSEQFTLNVEILNIAQLFRQRGDRSVRTFVEFLGSLGVELHKGSKPRQDGSQLVPGTHDFDGLFDRFEIVLRDHRGDPCNLIAGERAIAAPKPKPPMGKTAAKPKTLPETSITTEALAVPESKSAKKVQVVEVEGSVDVVTQMRIQALEAQVAKQKHIIENLVDIIKNGL